jgi:O-antigen ligase
MMSPTGDVLSPGRAVHRPPGLTLAHLAFLVGVFLTPFHLRFSNANFSFADAAILVAAFLTVLGRQPIHFLPVGLSTAAYIFLLFALLSTFRAPQPGESLTQILQFGFTFFVQLPVTLTLAQPRLVVPASLGLLLAARLADNTTALLSGRASGSHRALSYYTESANQLAYPTAYLLPFLLCGLLQILRGPSSKLVRALAILGAIPALYLMFWVLASSGSRSATLATILGVGTFLTFRRRFTPSPRVALRFALIIAVVSCLAYALYQSGYFPSRLRERIELSIHHDNRLTHDRVELARAGWRAFIESPFLGVGLDNFRHVAARYGLLTLATDPHNMWIDLLAKVGLFGTVALFSLLAAWFVVLLRTYRSSAEHSRNELLSAFVASMVAIMTIHMFVPLMLQRQYWLIYGLGLAWALHTTARHHAPSAFSFVRMQGEAHAR